MFVTILGRPGSGKSTLGRLLEESTGLRYVGGGALFREYVRRKRPGWRAVQRNLETRTDNPPELQLQVLRETLGQMSASGALLDGFPKTPMLAAEVDDRLPEPITLALYLEVPVEQAAYRISHR